MVKKAIKAEVKSFVKGLITEASPLNFPENASLDECNFELLRDGTRQRRLGFDCEPGFQFNSVFGMTPSDLQSAKVNCYTWESVNGENGKDFLVIQINNSVDMYDLRSEFLSADGFVGSVGIPPSSYSGQDISFTTVDGVLVMALGDYLVYYVTYDNGVFTTNSYSLKVRDFWGVEDATPTNNPYFYETEYSTARMYNLYNQSWGIPRRWEGAGEKALADPPGYYFSQYARYPSNAETVWTALTTKADANPYEYMRPSAWAEKLGILPAASKGFFIIDMLKRGASRTQAVEENKARFQQVVLETITTPSDITPGGPKIVTEFAGRVFYAGFSGDVIDGSSRSPSLSNYVAFSQVVKDKSDLGKCYQEGDPTSREGNDIVDTDGGYVRITGAADILSMQSIGASLIIIASNGVWSLTGGSDYGFSATNYKVTELSSFGCISKDSVIKAGDIVFFWGHNSIFTISKNNAGDLIVASITDETIQTRYLEISLNTKSLCKGVYDDVSKTARWMYFDELGFGTQSVVNELVLDTKLGAFYCYKISNPANFVIRASFVIPSSQELLSLEPVAVGVDLVYSNIDAVVTNASRRSPSKSGVKYLVFKDVSGTPSYSFAYYINQEFLDWGSSGSGIDAKAYLLTGAITGGDSSVSKQAPYIVTHMLRTEDGVTSEKDPVNQSGCLMRAQWGWANSASSNKWGQFQQIYKYTRGYTTSSSDSLYDTGFELITSKSKIRGAGKALSIYFESEAGKDCKLIGWSISINGNSIT